MLQVMRRALLMRFQFCGLFFLFFYIVYYRDDRIHGFLSNTRKRHEACSPSSIGHDMVAVQEPSSEEVLFFSGVFPLPELASILTGTKHLVRHQDEEYDIELEPFTFTVHTVGVQ